MNYQIGPYRLDLEGRVIWLDSAIVRLPPKAIDFLICLVERNGEVVAKAEIRERVWPGISVEENSITQVASLIRRAMKPGLGDAEVIEAVPRRGYRLAITPVYLGDAATPAEDQDVGPQPFPGAGDRTPAPLPEARSPRRILQVGWAIGLVAAALSILVGARVLNPGSPRLQVYPLTDVSFDEVMPSISPDGNQVVYSRKLPGEAVYDLYVKVIGGAPPKKLTHSEGNAIHAAWSPDGELIAYSEWFPDHGEVRVVTPLGRGDQMLVRLNTICK